MVTGGYSRSGWDHIPRRIGPLEQYADPTLLKQLRVQCRASPIGLDAKTVTGLFRIRQRSRVYEDYALVDVRVA